jgi:hypothetical protein
MAVRLGANRWPWKTQGKRLNEPVCCMIRFLLDRQRIIAVPIGFAAFVPDQPVRPNPGCPNTPAAWRSTVVCNSAVRRSSIPTGIELTHLGVTLARVQT